VIDTDIKTTAPIYDLRIQIDKRAEMALTEALRRFPGGPADCVPPRADLEACTISRPASPTQVLCDVEEIRHDIGRSLSDFVPELSLGEATEAVMRVLTRALLTIPALDDAMIERCIYAASRAVDPQISDEEIATELKRDPLARAEAYSVVRAISAFLLAPAVSAPAPRVRPKE
jgi:hypothetical protein